MHSQKLKNHASQWSISRHPSLERYSGDRHCDRHIGTQKGSWQGHYISCNDKFCFLMKNEHGTPVLLDWLPWHVFLKEGAHSVLHEGFPSCHTKMVYQNVPPEILMVYDQMESEYLPNRRIQIKKCFIQGKNIINVHLKRELILVSILFFSSKGKWNQNYICSNYLASRNHTTSHRVCARERNEDWTERQHFSQLKAAKLKHNLDNIKLVCTTKYILFHAKKFPISLARYRIHH